MKPKYTRRYFILGALFGLIFPALASIIDLRNQELTFTLSNLVRIHGSNPLHWVIDTAPIILALFSAIAGRRQDQNAAINEELEDKFIERQQMVARLVALQNDLERQVESRTADLNLRKSQFEAVAEVARATAGIRELDILLDQSTDLISKAFGFYHAGIFLIDDSRQYAELKAASSPGGKRMLASGHRMEIGVKGLVGHVGGTGEPRIALDVGVDAVYFDNPEMPETRSELAIPLKIRDEVIGVLDVQSKKAGAFSEEDLHALQLLGDQLALAIETSHLIQEKEEAFEAMNHAYREFTQESWFTSFRSQPDIAFRCDSRGHIFPLTNHRKSGLETGLSGDSSSDDDERAITLPLKIRDQTVGEVRFSKPAQAGKWTEDDISLLQTLTDQVSIAMDSARLYRDSQRRAERERLVADITTKMRESNDPKQILQTAVHELQSALKAQRTQIKFQSLDTKDINPPPPRNVSEGTGNNGNPVEGGA